MTIRAYKNISPGIADTAYIDESAVVIGDVHIGEDSSIWPLTAVRGDVNKIRIGARTNIQDNSVVHVTHQRADLPDGYDVQIGDDVTIGHNVIVHGCHIGNFCLIGMGSTLMDGVIIEDYCIVGAGSLVTQNRTLNSGLWVGRPAKRVRDLNENELKYLKYSSQHYVNLKNDYISG